MNPKFIVFVGLLFALIIDQRGNVEAQKSPARPLICGCANGWQGFKGFCYKMITAVQSSFDQSNANDACHDMGAKLASIHSQEEQDFVLSLMDKDNVNAGYWIGLLLHRHTVTKELISCSWMDGSLFDYGECKENSGKGPWANSTKSGIGSEPNGSKVQECVFIRGDKKEGYVKSGWVDQPCIIDGPISDELGYVCKK